MLYVLQMEGMVVQIPRGFPWATSGLFLFPEDLAGAGIPHEFRAVSVLVPLRSSRIGGSCFVRLLVGASRFFPRLFG